MCVSIEIVCPSDGGSECRRLYERVRELVDIVAVVTASCIEVKKLFLPAPKEWFEVGLPMILIREKDKVQVIEASTVAVTVEESDIKIYSVVGIAIDESAALQLLRAEAVSL